MTTVVIERVRSRVSPERGRRIAGAIEEVLAHVSPDGAFLVGAINEHGRTICTASSSSIHDLLCLADTLLSMVEERARELPRDARRQLLERTGLCRATIGLGGRPPSEEMHHA
ncbi:hypothetical protein STVA_41730 [Allostella vacuolata]|nr:hypothetical protein STVA_41730 [Stella vacuolata]